MVKGRDPDGSRCLGKLLGGLEGFVNTLAAKDDLRPIGHGRLELRKRNTHRSEDGGLDALLSRRKRHPLRVVSGTSGYHPSSFFLIGELGDAVIGAANFIRAGSLQIFTLQVDGLAQHL